jgi:peroxiredoxin Q/BCP
MKKALILFFALLLFSGYAFAADMPKEGAEAPGFTLPNQEGKQTTLGDMKGKWVVLYFYPKDFTKGCSIEAHNFQEDIKKYADKNATIVGVSVDAPDSHKNFCAKEGLNFTLLADTAHKVSELYDSTMSLGIATLSARNTFLIDPKGIIRKEWVKVDPDKHSEEVLAALTELQAAK